MLLNHKVALITGASSGIGKACAMAFAREGARVVLSDIAVEAGEKIAEKINSENGQAIFYPCDVSKSDEVRDLMAHIIQTYGRLDCACNNAGIEGAQATTAEYPDDAWQKVLDVNLTGAWLCMKYEISHMLEQAGGSIVNMASILSKVGFAQASAYVAAKHGLLGLTKTAAIEYATHGIRVNAVCPGFIETAMLERGGMTAGSDIHDMLVELHPMKRLGRSEEIAEAVVWLCSDAASFVTGEALMVDGGYIAQ